MGTAAAYALVTPKPGFGVPFVIRPAQSTLLEDDKVVVSMSPFDANYAGKDLETKLTVQIRLADVEVLADVGAASMLAHIVKMADRIMGIAERRLFDLQTPRPPWV